MGRIKCHKQTCKLLVMCRESRLSRCKSHSFRRLRCQGRKFYRALNGGGRTPSSPPSPLWEQASTVLRVVYSVPYRYVPHLAYSFEQRVTVQSTEYVATNHTVGSISLPIAGLKLQHHAAVRKYPDTDAPCLAMESPGSSGKTRLSITRFASDTSIQCSYVV